MGQSGSSQELQWESYTSIRLIPMVDADCWRDVPRATRGREDTVRVGTLVLGTSDHRSPLVVTLRSKRQVQDLLRRI